MFTFNVWLGVYMKLIVGKNSKIVKSIADELVGVDIVSHKEVGDIDFSVYKKIVIFSWSFNCQKDNIDLIESIPAEKIVFISTTAVKAQDKRPQWASYPVLKHAAEKLVLSKGGSVVRIGIWSRDVLNRFLGVAPFTSRDQLIGFLNSDSCGSERVRDLVVVEQGAKPSWRVIPDKILNYLSDFLPNKPLFQGPIILAFKLLGISSYGYTRDSSSFYFSKVQVGFGALGSRFFDVQKKKPEIVFCSFYRNKMLANRGFNGTLIGFDFIGLSRLWHGVSILSRRGWLIKHVPYIVRRPKPPCAAAKKAHVEKLSFLNELFCIDVVLPNGETKQFFSENLVLAAGPVENCRLLRDLSGAETPCYFSDHEIATIGTIRAQDALEKNLIKKKSFFIARGALLACKIEGVKMLLEFKPFVNGKEDSGFYNRQTSGIIRKLITNFSFSRLNEAIYNKFGFALGVERYAVFMQALNENCIYMDSNGMLSRKRFSQKIIANIQKDIKKQLNLDTFRPIKLVETYDAQHIVGGYSVLNDSINELTSHGRLNIVGSPTDYKLGIKHHTQQIIESFLELT